MRFGADDRRRVSNGYAWVRSLMVAQSFSQQSSQLTGDYFILRVNLRDGIFVNTFFPMKS